MAAVAEFSYKGRSSNGALVNGRLHGESTDAIASRLLGLGVTPVEITPVTAQAGMTVEELWRRAGGGRPTTKDLILFSRQMHTITRTGLPLLRGLSGLMETTHNVVLKTALIDVIASLEAGRGLSKSFARHPDIFSDFFVNIIEIGEATGTMDTAFLRMQEYLSAEQNIRDRVRSAVRYPAIVMVAIAVAISIITIFVIPNFAPIFRSLGDNIPLPTRIIMGVSDFAVNHWPVVLLFFAAATVAFNSYIKTAVGRLRWDRLKLSIPVTGIIASNAALSRILRSLTISLEAGLPMNDTLRAVAPAIGNEYLAQKMSGLGTQIERGESLSSTARASDLFTPLVLQMITLGEETGALPELLSEAADHYEREVDYDLDNLSAALEPILIVTVGVIVLVLALGVFLPMWDMIGAARSGG